MKNLRKNKKGFTLIEVIVVLVILAIIIALAVPSVMKYIDDANDAKYLAQARAVYVAADAEIAKDYAPDSNLGFVGATAGNQLKDLVEKALDTSEFEMISVEAFTKTDATGAIVANTKPSAIKSYKIVIKVSDTESKTVVIAKNGTAEIK